MSRIYPRILALLVLAHALPAQWPKYPSPGVPLLPDGKCLPLGIVWLHSHIFPRKILQVPGEIVIL